MNILRIAAIATIVALPSLALAQDDFDVAEVYAKDCTKCHADDGSGLTKKGRQLRLKDYRDPKVQAEMSDEEIVKSLKEGIIKKGEEVMNAYPYTDEQIAAMLAYVRAFAAK